MQHEITVPKPLLDERGHLNEAGYARSLLLGYDRKAIRANSLRIKEWDYYYVGNAHFGLALTIADNSYMGLDSISFLDFDDGWERTKSPLQIMTRGKKGLPPSSTAGDVISQGKDYLISFENRGGERVLSLAMARFQGHDEISGKLTLACPPTDSMVIATPFGGHKRAFYYNQKINCMQASGRVTLGKRDYVFDPGDSFAVLDWGRGVWTYQNTWYWGSASGTLDGVPFGFNLGYGFGDTAAASENMLFYNGRGHKLTAVTFEIPQKEGKDDFMSPWRFTSADRRFEMDFVPVLERKAKTDLLLLCSDQHQIFGRFSGKAVLDDNTVLTVKDFFGFAEKVFNKW